MRALMRSYTTSDSVQVSRRAEIVVIAARYRLPVMDEFVEIARAGALLSYGPNREDLWRRSAGYVHKILNGSKPGDLPIEQPTKFDLVVNLNTARALSIEVPPLLLARADEVIE
jgi:putative ABC transport system substrate-binding protein